MNKFISLFLASVFFVTSTIQFNYYFKGMYLQNNRTFDSYAEAFDFYEGVVNDNSQYKDDRVEALYVLTDIALNHDEDLSAEQLSWISNKCSDGQLASFDFLKYMVMNYAQAKNIYVSADSSTSYMLKFKNKYTGTDVEKVHALLLDCGFASTGSIRTISSSGSENLVTAAEEMQDFIYYYTKDGYMSSLQVLRTINSIDSEMYSLYQQKLYELKLEHPNAIFRFEVSAVYYDSVSNSWITINRDGSLGTSISVYWIDSTEAFYVWGADVDNYSEKYFYGTSYDSFYGLDWNPYIDVKYFVVTDEHQVFEGDFSMPDNRFGLRISNRLPGFNRLYLEDDFSDIYDANDYAPYMYSYKLNNESTAYHYSAFSYALTFGNKRHMAFLNLNKFRNWSLGGHSLYIGSGPTSDVYNQNFNEENYYQTFNYITEAVQGLSPEEFQAGINAVINEISESGEEIYKETKETNKLLQKIYKKLEAILDHMDDKREDSTSNGGIWIGDLLYFILYLLYAILILADFLSLAASCFDWFNHLWAISPSPGIVAGNEWFIGAHNILHGGVAFGLEEPIVIFGFLTLHDFMVLIFQFAFWAVVISTAKKKATELNIPEIGRRR